MAYSLSMYQAISIVIYIALKMGESRYEYLTTKNISEILGIARPTAVKIINHLNNAGITVAKEGARGGILLAKPIEQITLLDIFKALENNRPLFKTGGDIQCPEEECAIWEPRIDALKNKVNNGLSEAENAMKQSLQSTTIFEILQEIQETSS